LGQTAAGTGLTKAQKEAIVFTDFIKELITGLILSDASIEFSKGYGKGNARLQIKQKDREFVTCLYESFENAGLAAGEPQAPLLFSRRVAKLI
jgi:hypothetical protein